jgi:hypothetical protein
MYPAEPGPGDDMFHDIIDLGVRRDGYSLETHKIKSIAFLSADVIFYSELWSQWDIAADLPNGQRANIKIPLMDEQGLILSKCESIKGIKRGRDAFDIYHVLSGPAGHHTAERLAQLAANLPGTKVHLQRLREYIREEPVSFNERVARYANGTPLTDCAALVLKMLPEIS